MANKAGQLESVKNWSCAACPMWFNASA